jgi:hypothetical protein
MSMPRGRPPNPNKLTSAQRSRKLILSLELAGGKRLVVNLRASGVQNLQILRTLGPYPSDTAAVHDALEMAAKRLITDRPNKETE